ncbi:hypothetical protein ACS0TY_024950 [Phlomoides rotata]
MRVHDEEWLSFGVVTEWEVSDCEEGGVDDDISEADGNPNPDSGTLWAVDSSTEILLTVYEVLLSVVDRIRYLTSIWNPVGLVALKS